MKKPAQGGRQLGAEGRKLLRPRRGHRAGGPWAGGYGRQHAPFPAQLPTPKLYLGLPDQSARPLIGRYPHSSDSDGKSRGLPRPLGHTNILTCMLDLIFSAANSIALLGWLMLIFLPHHRWTRLILHRDTSLYGAYGYDPDQDVARFRVPAGRSERFYESLTFDLDFIPNDARLYLSWGHLQLSFPIETGTDAGYLAYLEAEVFPGGDTQALVLAAEYLSKHVEGIKQECKVMVL